MGWLKSSQTLKKDFFFLKHLLSNEVKQQVLQGIPEQSNLLSSSYSVAQLFVSLGCILLPLQETKFPVSEALACPNF